MQSMLRMTRAFSSPAACRHSASLGGTRIDYQLPVVPDTKTPARRPGDYDFVAPRLECARPRTCREARWGNTVRDATRPPAEFLVADRPHVAPATGHHAQAINEIAAL